jgi:hypothetical protein
MKSTIVVFCLVVFAGMVNCQVNPNPQEDPVYSRVESFTSSNRINMVSAGDFSAIIKDNKISRVFFTDNVFIIESNSILYTLASKGYRSIADLADGDAKGFKEGQFYYYAKEHGLTSQEEVDYYRQELFFSGDDYRDALRLGFVKNRAEHKTNSLVGLIRKDDLEKNIRYINAVVYLSRSQYSDNNNALDKSFIDNKSVEALMAASENAIKPFGDYYYIRIGVSENTDYSVIQRRTTIQDAVFYYVCKAAQYLDLADYTNSRRTGGSAVYTIKNTASIVRELGFQSYDDFRDAVSGGFTNSGDYYLAKKYKIDLSTLQIHRLLINELELVKQRYTTGNTLYALMIIQLLKRQKGVPISVDIFTQELAQTYGNNVLFLGSGFYSQGNQFDTMYNEVPQLRNLIMYDASGKSFYLK